MILLTTFINWSASNTEALIGYMKDLIGDLSPLLIVIISVGLGLIIFSVIIGAIRGHQ